MTHADPNPKAAGRRETAKAHRWAWLAVAAVVWGCGGNHERASESTCAEQPVAAADLCWSHVAIERAESNPAQALDLAQHITDVQTRDITILALFGKLPNPRDRLDACRAIQGTLSREKCLTYQQRPHLWVLADDTESTAPSTERPATASTGVCAHLPAQLRDACALQTVLSSAAGVEASGQAAAIDQTRCSAISDTNARAFCGTEIAVQVAQVNGLDAGISACGGLARTLSRNECYLRVRSVRADAPMEKQVAACRLAGDLFGPCLVMIRTSAAATLIERYGEAPVLEALDEIDLQIRAFVPLLGAMQHEVEGTSAEQSVTFVHRELWMRIFALLTKDSGSQIQGIERWRPVLEQLDPNDPRRALLRGALLRAFGFVSCPETRRLAKSKSDSSTPPDWCKTAPLLVERFVQWTVERRDQGPVAGSALGPLSPDASTTATDGRRVNLRKVGVLPRPLALGCPMTQGEADQIAAMSALADGRWLHISEAFRLALLSKYGTVRMVAAQQLIRRLFVQGPHFGDRDATAASLREWMLDLSPNLRLLAEKIVIRLDRGDFGHPRLVRMRECPSALWPEDGSLQP